MKMPQKPPNSFEIMKQFKGGIERFWEIYVTFSGPLVGGKYLHWDKLRYYTPSQNLSYEEWWLMLKWQRQSLYKKIPLLDKKGDSFNYLLVDPVFEMLHKIDQGAGGFVQMPEQITNPETKDQYFINSLISEAITSSQLEGAATTRLVAKEMIRTGRPPQDKSERMILNNFLTMKQIEKLRTESLTPSIVFDIHRLITDKTLSDPSAVGRFRRADERIVVGDMYNEVFHEPPPADQLESRMTAMCDFANGKTPAHFIHPVIRSIILHFWLAYDHPFGDGNGRTARALFYWSMLHHGFWLFEFISISQIILKAPAKYGRAFLYTETDDNDLTYFIIYHLKVIERAINELHDYIRRKTESLRAVEHRLRILAGFNHRQRALIGHALRHPQQQYTIESHRMSHNIVYQTARTDLFDLENRGLFESRKISRTWYFTPVSNLEDKLIKLSEAL
jgi:Fic family protein